MPSGRESLPPAAAVMARCLGLSLPAENIHKARKDAYDLGVKKAYNLRVKKVGEKLKKILEKKRLSFFVS